METNNDISDSEETFKPIGAQFKFNSQLCCHLCKNPFPSNHSFFIKIDKSSQVENAKVVEAVYSGNETENLICVPCINRRAGIDPEERNKAKRARFGLAIDIKLLPSVKIKKQKIKINDQPSLF